MGYVDIFVEEFFVASSLVSARVLGSGEEGGWYVWCWEFWSWVWVEEWWGCGRVWMQLMGKGDGLKGREKGICVLGVLLVCWMVIIPFYF